MTGAQSARVGEPRVPAPHDLLRQPGLPQPVRPRRHRECVAHLLGHHRHQGRRRPRLGAVQPLHRPRAPQPDSPVANHAAEPDKRLLVRPGARLRPQVRLQRDRRLGRQTHPAEFVADRPVFDRAQRQRGHQGLRVQAHQQLDKQGAHVFGASLSQDYGRVRAGHRHLCPSRVQLAH